jgi:hypothetical protein
MIAALALAHASLAEDLGAPPFAALVADARAEFERACGGYEPSDACFEERSAALTDRVLTRAAVGARFGAADGARGTLLRALARAERGLFSLRRHDARVDLECVVCGGAFRLAPADDLAGLRTAASGGTAARESTAPGLIDGHVVPTPSGVVMLPGVLVHTAEATSAIVALSGAPAVREMPHAALLDALLLLRHQLATRTRSRPHQVYRVEALRAARPDH